MAHSDALIDTAGAYIRKKAMEQSWFKKNANTVTAVLGLLATLLTWLASQPFAASENWQKVILIAGFVLTILGVKKTPNGWSDSQIQKLADAEAHFIDKTPLIPWDKSESNLKGQIKAYNKRQAEQA